MRENSPDITEQSEVFEFIRIGEIIDQALQKKTTKKNSYDGLSTGFFEIDNVISGLQKGQLITIAVRPGMGKTAFLLSMANNIAIRNNNSIAIFSSERSSLKITNRIIESETGMSVGKLKSNDISHIEKDHLNDIINNIAKAKIFLDDTPSIAVEELVKKSRQLKCIHNVDLIVIDYLELLSTYSSSDNSREEQLNTIVHTLKSIAEELDIPIVLFSQLQGLGLEYNFSKKPSITDIPVVLSEISDVVMFLHRSDFIGKAGRKSENVEMIIARHDNQNRETIVPLKYLETIAKFANS